MTANEATHSRARALGVPLLVASLALLAGWLRASNYAVVFYAGRVLPVTNDAVYHLWRMLYATSHSLAVPTHDPLLNWPHGGNCLWAPGFDFIAALAPWLLGIAGNEAQSAMVLVWVPVVLGLLVVWLTGHAASRLAATPGQARFDALLTQLLCATLPICIFTATLGRTDHHVAEELAVVGLLLWVLERFPSADFRARTLRQRSGFELRGSCVLAFGLFVFSGSCLYAVIALAVIALATLREPSASARAWPPLAGSGAPAALLAALIAFALYLPGILVHRHWLSFVFPSLLQPGVVALAGVGLAGVVAAGRVLSSTTPGARTLCLRAALALGLALPVVALATPVWRVLWAGAQLMLRVGNAEPATIVEFLPLVDPRNWSSLSAWKDALHYFGPLCWLGFVLAPLGVRAAAREQHERAWTLGFFLAVFFVLTARQSRFARELGPLLVIAVALGVRELADRLLRRTPPRGQAGTASERDARPWLAALLGVALAFSPSATRNRIPAAAAEAPVGAQAASLYLADHARPRASGSRAGALTDSFSGAFMMWPARVPVVANNMGDRPQVRAALTGTEQHALAFMAQRDLQWFVPSTNDYALIVLKPAAERLIAADDAGRARLNAHFLQRVPLAISVLGGGGIPEAAVAHLAHLLPRWVSADGMGGLPFFLPAAWVYERVRGAQIHGVTAKAALVVARTELLARGQPLPYAAWVRADERGEFTLTVALPSAYRTDTLATGAAWQVSVLGGRGEAKPVIVRARDVEQGTTLELGVLEP
jgi:asparagine N-glycosylation enzyme membrane subunit Stt3